MNYLEELAHRSSQESDVQLLWFRDEAGLARTFVRVTEQQLHAEVEVAPAEALEAFNHPYAYLGDLAVKHSD